MKIVQSFWTKPFLRSKGGTLGSRLNGGWVGKKYNYYSMALSCLQLRKYYGKVELVTDELGKFLLVDQMNLPFTDCVVALNRLDDYDDSLWALGKLYAYSIQQEPFLHVDGDIFIMKKFAPALEQAGLVAQNIERGDPDYTKFYRYVLDNYKYIPKYIQNTSDGKPPCYSNAGVIGGANLSFFREYTSEAFAFVKENTDCLQGHGETMDITMLNFLFEQNLYYLMAEQTGTEISYLFPDVEKIPPYIGYFHAADRNAGFIHALGDQKRSMLVYSMLEAKLQMLYPACYKRINQLIHTSEI